MRPRDPHEPHRVSTPLELLFDLVSVIAIAAAAAGLHHAIAQAHVGEGLVKFAGAFFAIWWAWMNYTWFASAYDNDDVVFRLLTLLIMVGALTMAAGVKPFFDVMDMRLIVVGFVIMRLAMVMLWLRAAHHDPARRRTAVWYAAGITLVQVYWVALLLLQPAAEVLFYSLFALGALLELMVPALAERQGITPWHRHHIVERYGLLNIIVLGETVLAGSMALGQASGAHVDPLLIRVALASLVIVFSLWWLYFAREEHLAGKNLSATLTWGYGHALIYMSGAAVGAGFAVLVDVVSQHATTSFRSGLFAVAVPVALYLVGLWFVRDRFALKGTTHGVLLIFAGLILLAPLLANLEGVAILTALSVWVRSRIARRTVHDPGQALIR